MALYLIGDVQGCDEPLGRLLAQLDFSPSRDTLVLLGDLVNRGPDSAGVLRRLMALGESAQCLLGNHDLHLLALAHGVRQPGGSDTLDGVLAAPDRAAMLDWLRQQKMALRRRVAGQDILMVHAGVLPQWTTTQTLALAGEVEAVLRGPGLDDFLHQMYGNEPARWHDGLQGMARIRCIVNALTRIRFCTPEGEMEFDAKGLRAIDAPPGYQPWFAAPGRKTAGSVVAFGHWSTLGWLDRTDLWSLDSGCVWGGCLSALRLEDGPAGAQADGPGVNGTQQQTLIQVKCAAAQNPGI
jgi:bis(5'-nucleosyl)-tetraphosphatase (symmetrical)